MFPQLLAVTKFLQKKWPGGHFYPHPPLATQRLKAWPRVRQLELSLKTFDRLVSSLPSSIYNIILKHWILDEQGDIVVLSRHNMLTGRTKRACFRWLPKDRKWNDRKDQKAEKSDDGFIRTKYSWTTELFVKCVKFKKLTIQLRNVNA